MIHDSGFQFYFPEMTKFMLYVRICKFLMGIRKKFVFLNYDI